MHIGRRNQLGIAIGEGEPTHYIPFLSCDLQERHTPIADTQAKGMRDAEGGQSVEGKKWADGKIEVVLDPTTAPYWLALALGKIDSEPATGDYYEHTITQETENEPLTATIWRDRVVDAVEFPNSVVNTLELNFADDVAKVSVDIMSKFPVEQDRTPTETELTYYTFRNATVKIGGETIKVRELTLKIENDAEMIYAPGSNDVDRIAWKSLRVSGSFKLLFEDDTQLTAFKTLAKAGMVITFAGSSEGDKDEIEITIPKFRVDDWKEDAEIDDLVHEDITFVAEYDADTEKTISAKVTNKVAGYITS